MAVMPGLAAASGTDNTRTEELTGAVMRWLPRQQRRAKRRKSYYSQVIGEGAEIPIHSQSYW